MKFVFVFPYNTWGGAFRSTYVLSNNLIKKDHEVTIVFPFFPIRNHLKIFSFDFIKYFTWGLLRSLIRYKNIPFKVNAKIKFVPFISNIFMPKADIIIANHWNTAIYVHRLSKICGDKFIYIRDVEQWSDYYKNEIKAFKLPLKKIATTNWIKKYLETNENINIDYVVKNGTEWENFHVNNKLQKDKISILMCYATHPMKNMKLGVSVLKKIKKKYPNIEIKLFGFPFKPKLDFDFTYFYRPTGKKLKTIYAESEIYFCPSLQEGYHNPPREAMSAKCSIVATNVGCILDLGRHYKNMLITSPHDKISMINYLEILINNQQLRIKLGNRANIDIRKNSWTKVTDDFLKIFK